MVMKIAVLIVLTPLLARAQQTPVSDAVHKGHAVGHEQDGIEAIRAALAAGGSVNERNTSGWTPLADDVRPTPTPMPNRCRR